MPGRLLHSPARVVAGIVIDLGLGSNPPTPPGAFSGWPVYYDKEPDGKGTPDSVVTVFDTTGLDYGREMVSGERATFDGIQIRVRCANKQEGFSKANEIATELSRLVNKIQTVETSTYRVQSIRLTGAVVPIGKEVTQTQRNVFTINALVTIKMLT